MDRRDFFKTSLASAALLTFSGFESLHAKGKLDPAVGRAWKGWKPGHFQIHFIYTGVCESAFYIFPDGTTMLIDCGDHNAVGRGKLAVPVLPHSGKHSGEWIARYVERVNPHGTDVDYMMLSHYHNDHAGSMDFYASKEIRDGREHVLSGFTQAAETLRFHKGIDRAWPGFDDPLPMSDDFDSGAVAIIKEFYRYEQEHHGMTVEKYRLGATDQIVPVHDPSKCKGFSVRNICGNGRVCAEDGTVTDIYAERIRKEGLKTLNENGMSLGLIISYGPFRFFTAGDFSDKWPLPDGSLFRTEDVLSEVCAHVNVAKINHHGHRSMSKKLVSALSAQVYVCCVWDQLHTLPDTMENISDRSLYPGDRVVCPGIFPPERRAQDDGQEWMKDITPASYEGSHVILDVEPGGKAYSINYVSAADESMTVRSVLKFKTENSCQ